MFDRLSALTLSLASAVPSSGLFLSHSYPLEQVNLVVGALWGVEVGEATVNSKRQAAHIRKVPVIIPSQYRRLCLLGLGEVIIKWGGSRATGWRWVDKAKCFSLRYASSVFVKWSTIYSWIVREEAECFLFYVWGVRVASAHSPSSRREEPELTEGEQFIASRLLV